MFIGVIGKKLGMSQLFLDNGVQVPVTLISLPTNVVVDVKTHEKDSYSALAVGVASKKVKNMAKPQIKSLEKKGLDPLSSVKEFRVNQEHSYKVGDLLNFSEFFEADLKVDVIGTSKGKGFAGVMKRHNFAGLRASHGVSISHRSHGSTGQNQDPGRVFKGKKMAGQLGNVRTTIQNIKVAKYCDEMKVLFLVGNVPGPKGSELYIRPAVKQKA